MKLAYPQFSYHHTTKLRTNIVEAPGDHKGFLAASDTGATPYFVAVKKTESAFVSVKVLKLPLFVVIHLLSRITLPNCTSTFPGFILEVVQTSLQQRLRPHPGMRGKSLAKSLAFGEPGQSHHQEMMTATQIGVRTWRLQVSKMSSYTTLNG